MSTNFIFGLVGSVSNGKTTLVERLSSTCTRRHSSEKKSGRTIQLGYASMILWKCDACQSILSSNHKMTTFKCDACALPMTLAFRISLVDAPGHSQYVKTMIRGSSVMDAAIVVTDVTQPPEQHQTLEHLLILEVLGVKHILVIQNKCDLVTEEKCKEHHVRLCDQFKGTAAENAVVVPICAQRDMNVDIVVEQLYHMCLKLQQRQSPNVETKSGFAVIRSFDINKVGSEVADLKGGVLGGTWIGQQPLRVGDKVEIRPGVIPNVPLYTTVRSIFADSLQVSECTSGMLCALGTNLDPTLTKNDRLIGTLVGFPNSLPEVCDKLTLKITNVKIDGNMSKVATDKLYTFVLGNVVVNGTTCASEKRNVFHILFEKPICCINLHRCLIYEKQQKATRLIGFGNKVSS